MERHTHIHVEVKRNKAGRLLSAEVIEPEASASVDRCVTSALKRPFEPNLPGVKSTKVDPKRTRVLKFLILKRSLTATDE